MRIITQSLNWGALVCNNFLFETIFIVVLESSLLFDLSPEASFCIKTYRKINKLDLFEINAMLLKERVKNEELSVMSNSAHEIFREDAKKGDIEGQASFGLLHQK